MVQFLKLAIVDFKSGVMIGVAGDGGAQAMPYQPQKDDHTMINTAFQIALDDSSKYIGRSGTTHSITEFRASLETQLGKDFDLEPIRVLIRKRGSDIIWD